MNHIEFSVSRLRQIWDATSEESQFLAEVAYLYDQIVQTGTQEPIIDVGMKLMIPFTEVGEAVSTAMALGYISAPKQGTFGGRITNKARKVLGQPLVKPTPKVKETEKPKSFLDRIVEKFL